MASRQPRTQTVLISIILLLAACGGSAPTRSESAAASEPERSTSASAPTSIDSPIVGEWIGTHDCERIVEALGAAGFDEATILEVVVGERLVPDAESPEDLADPTAPCADAVPREHGHFFTNASAFGSTDFDGEQVDDGTFTVVDDDTLVISPNFTETDAPATEFGYTIDGDTLTLEPIVPDGCVEFVCLWSIMVAMAGEPLTLAGSREEAAPERFAVADDGRELVIFCEGEGTPTVILEDGHPSETGGVSRFTTSPIWDDLTAHTRACAYDRAGWGDSDPAPMEPRTADDVVDDLQALLAAAGEDGPYVLAGSSFGGFIVTYYAAREPDDVVGVVLLDGAVPDPTLTLEEIPEIAWDHPENPERVDVIPEFETRFAEDPQPIDAPLTIVTASGGDSGVEGQAFWFRIDPEATQVELAGGHDIDFDNPAGVVAEIMKAVEAAR
jgi:pimeloyl-ACP methyl ester carboxylesterase